MARIGGIIETETYQGWKNYPTWAVNLWLTNDEGIYSEMQHITAEFDEDEKSEFAEAIKNYVCEDLCPDLGASFAQDLLGYALEQVDWYEIAEAWE